MIRAILKRPRLQFRFTSTGKKTLILALIVGAGALNTGVNLLYLVFALLLGAIIASGVLSGITLWDVNATLRLPGHVFAREPFFGTVRTRNLKKRFASYSLWVLEASHGLLGKGAYFPKVMSGQNCTTEFRHAFPRRGLVKFDWLQLMTRFPFGLFEKIVKIKADQDVIVYPRIFQLEKDLSAALSGEGVKEKLRKGSGMDLFNIREYLPGDHPKHIHWKSSAHRSLLMVREFASEEEAKGIILFDNSFPARDASSALLFEAGVSLVASVADNLIRRGMQLDLAAWGQAEWNCSGEGGLKRILTLLALIKPLDDKDLKELPDPETMLESAQTGGISGVMFGFGNTGNDGRYERLDLGPLVDKLNIRMRMKQ
ncbi:DUF58 domain-containing protein [Acidobacteriota bacterium]